MVAQRDRGKAPPERVGVGRRKSVSVAALVVLAALACCAGLVLPVLAGPRWQLQVGAANDLEGAKYFAQKAAAALGMAATLIKKDDLYFVTVGDYESESKALEAYPKVFAAMPCLTSSFSQAPLFVYGESGQQKAGPALASANATLDAAPEIKSAAEAEKKVPPEAKPEAKPASGAVNATAQAGPRWQLQIGATDELERAKVFAQQATISLAMAASVIKKGDLYYVTVGDYASEAKALEAYPKVYATLPCLTASFSQAPLFVYDAPGRKSAGAETADNATIAEASKQAAEAEAAAKSQTEAKAEPKAEPKIEAEAVSPAPPAGPRWQLQIGATYDPEGAKLYAQQAAAALGMAAAVVKKNELVFVTVGDYATEAKALVDYPRIYAVYPCLTASFSEPPLVVYGEKGPKPSVKARAEANATLGRGSANATVAGEVKAAGQAKVESAKGIALRRAAEKLKSSLNDARIEGCNLEERQEIGAYGFLRRFSFQDMDPQSLLSEPQPGFEGSVRFDSRAGQRAVLIQETKGKNVLSEHRDQAIYLRPRHRSPAALGAFKEALRAMVLLCREPGP